MNIPIVVITKEDFRAAALEKSRTIDVIDLMQRLRRSLEQSGGKPRAAKRGIRPAKRAAKKRAKTAA